MGHHAAARAFPRCPHCGGGQWSRFDDRLMRCRGCSRLADFSEFEQPVPPKPVAVVPDGPFKRAGKIEIGRGFKWGAGLV